MVNNTMYKPLVVIIIIIKWWLVNMSDIPIRCTFQSYIMTVTIIYDTLK